MPPDAALAAVFATLLRATADPATPVLLRTRRPDAARALEQWLTRAHGSGRTVIASATGRGMIEVRLPARLRWTDLLHENTIADLAAAGSPAHYSPMAHHTSPAGSR
jgi:hypothetical protein